MFDLHDIGFALTAGIWFGGAVSQFGWRNKLWGTVYTILGILFLVLIVIKKIGG
jgi:hypothetical protein